MHAVPSGILSRAGRKGEKHLEQRSEIDPETVRLQAVGVCLRVDDGVPFA